MSQKREYRQITKTILVNQTKENDYTFFGWCEYNRDGMLYPIETFSVGIFKVVAKSGGKGNKAQPVVFRLKGVVGHEAWVDACASFICEQLNKKRPTPYFAKKAARDARDEFMKIHKPTWT